MVYESDFYTTRRPYSRPTISSYSVTRRQIPWEKVPEVPRPSQVPTLYTAFGKVGKFEMDKQRKPQPRVLRSDVGLPKGTQSVYPRRYPIPPPTPDAETVKPQQVVISRKYAPRRVTFEEATEKSPVKLPGDEFVEKLLSGEHPVAATPLPYTSSYKGPLKCYSTYYHA